MAEVTIVSTSPEETGRIGQLLGGSLEPSAVVILSGPLGSGKTVLVKGIAQALGITASVVSPSYTIASEYQGTLSLTHIDLYRIDQDEELELLGFDELSGGTGLTVVEWGEKAAHFLGGSTVRVTITLLGAQERKIKMAEISKDLADRLYKEFPGAEG